MAQDHLFALPEGLALAGYRIAEVLGSGGYGITYRAEEVALKRVVAIKEYLPNSFARRAADKLTVRPRDPKQHDLFAWGLERFRQEAETLVSLHHPNIVRVLRYFEANGTAYIVMVYERGTSLGARLQGRARLPWPAMEAMIAPLLDGVEVVHRARFLHRDIKPDNIYLREDGTPVLLDFGAARQAIGARTQAITSIVSPGYSPFEQYGKSAGDQGPWTDIYALGATFYRCIAGERPPPALDRIAGKTGMPSAAARGAGDYPPAFLAAVDRALAIRTEERPQHIAAWRAMLAGEAAPAARAGPGRVDPGRAGNVGAANVIEVPLEAGATLVAGPETRRRLGAAEPAATNAPVPFAPEPGEDGAFEHPAPDAGSVRLSLLAGALFVGIVGLLVALAVILGRAVG